MTLLGTAGGFGMHVTQHASGMTLAPDATPKLLLMGLLFLVLVLWFWMYLRSLERR